MDPFNPYPYGGVPLDENFNDSSEGDWASQSGSRLGSDLGGPYEPRAEPNLDAKECNVRVAVRVRPMNGIESERRDGKCVNCMEDGQTLQIVMPDGKSRPMTLHRVHNEYASQETVFNECGIKDLLLQALEGYAVTIFAYGQTGSGKTFTITGSETHHSNEMQGIVPRSLRYLFNQVMERPDMKFSIRAAYLEIYNEQVQDLLNPKSTSLPVRWTSDKGFYVENLFVVECEVLDDCKAVLEEGLRNRTTASHALNAHSSRSHGLMTLYLDSEVTDPNDGRVVTKHGKIHFVDLAGSEKVKETKGTGEVFSEMLNINKSLLTLGNCIAALADSKKRNGHIPYRDSKLTKLLADSLGGNGWTLMIACISPSTYCSHETMKTLRYADRAKLIKNKPIIQMDPREELILHLKKDLRRTREELLILKQAFGLDQSEALLAQPRHGAYSATGSQRGGELKTNTKFDNLTSPPPLSTSSASAMLELGQTKMILQDVMNENDHLKFENAELLGVKQRTDASRALVLRENERLLAKLKDAGINPGTPLYSETDPGASSERPGSRGSTQSRSSSTVPNRRSLSKSAASAKARFGGPSSSSTLEKPHPPSPQHNLSIQQFAALAMSKNGGSSSYAYGAAGAAPAHPRSDPGNAVKNQLMSDVNSLDAQIHSLKG